MPDPQKRKKPPTFRHYPPDRARKLKKDWVERAKIKSKWKAQKRRDDIVSLRSGGVLQGEQRQELDIDDGHSHDKGTEGSSHSDSNSTSEISIEHARTASADSSSDDSNKSSPHSPNHRQKPNKQHQREQQQKNRSLPHDKNKTGSARDDATTATSPRDNKRLSVRELFQKAYSKSSLHTYKSDPFKRGRNHHHHQNRGGAGGGGSERNARGRSSNVSSRGRGQPNMKLRMNAMLAKINEQTKGQ